MTDRPLDHASVEILGHAECLRLLFGRRIGRVAFVEDGELTILPVRYLLHDGKIVFRSAVGAKRDAAVRQTVVAFEVDSWMRFNGRGGAYWSTDQSLISHRRKH